jgi:hypothetical protein
LIESDLAEECNFQMIDTKGTIIKTWKARVEIGQNQLEMPYNHQLAKGIYLIRYQSDTQNKTISIFNP